MGKVTIHRLRSMLDRSTAYGTHGIVDEQGLREAIRLLELWGKIIESASDAAEDAGRPEGEAVDVSMKFFIAENERLRKIASQALDMR